MLHASYPQIITKIATITIEYNNISIYFYVKHLEELLETVKLYMQSESERRSEEIYQTMTQIIEFLHNGQTVIP